MHHPKNRKVVKLSIMLGSLDVTLKIIQSLEKFVGHKIVLSCDSIRKFSEIIEVRCLKKNEFFCKQGQMANYISYVESGLVRLYYYKKQKDVTEHFGVDGEMFLCIESFFRREPSNMIVEALEKTTLHVMSKDKIDRLCIENNEIAYFYRCMLESCLILSQRKADSIRYETAHERYDRLVKEQPLVAKRAPLQYIASYLLMTPESLSRIRSGQL